MARRLRGGDVHELADHLNKFSWDIDAALHPLSNSVNAAGITNFSLSEFSIDQTATVNILYRRMPGPHGLPNWILRDFCTQLSGPICAIFNASIREGIVRRNEAKVIPVTKCIHRS